MCSHFSLILAIYAHILGTYVGVSSHFTSFSHLTSQESLILASFSHLTSQESLILASFSHLTSQESLILASF